MNETDSSSPDERVRELHDEAPLVDVHAHPSLKAWLFDRSVWDRGPSTSFLNPFSDRSSLTKALDGGFRVLFVAHHVPEKQLFEESFLLRMATRLLGMGDKLLSDGNFERLNEMVDQLEQDVNETESEVSIARTFESLQSQLETDRLVLLHAVEGGHVLERKLGRLDELADRGVVSLTLAHFFPNGIAEHVDAIPDTFSIKSVDSIDLFAGSDEGLTGFGQDVLDRMITLGMLPDLTHCAPSARREIYRHVPGDFPLLATHLGLEAYCPDPMNLTDDELEEIASRNGAVGLIFFKYYLDRNGSDSILESLWESINHIYEVTGSWDHIMVGTDFDGFTSPSYELKDATDMPTFTKMLLRRGLPDEVIRKILGGNAMRILNDVWQQPAGGR